MLDTAELKNLSREYRSSGKELSGKLAAAYLKKLPESALSRKDVVDFMLQHRENPVVQEYAAKYLKLLKGEQYTSADNSLFINLFKESLWVQKVILDYLDGLNNSQLKEKMSLLQQFADVQRGKEIGSRYLNSLSKSELYTADNLILLSKFTKGTNEPGFRIFYDSESAKKAEAIIRKKKGYEHARAKDFANNIFVQGDLSKAYFGSKEKENFDWNGLARKYEGKLRPEFIRENILYARVQALGILKENNKKFWPEYIKYNIEYREKYGFDTTSAFADSYYTNSFVFSGIFMHSTDPKQMAIGLKWMKDVIRRRPEDGNLIDTYANLLYKAGRKAEAIKWQEKSCGLGSKNRRAETLIPSLTGNLEKMKNNEPTWVELQ